MDFSAFGQRKTEEYAKQAKDKWQYVQAYQEFAEKSKRRSGEAENALAQGLMSFFEAFGKIKESTRRPVRCRSWQRICGHTLRSTTIPARRRP